MNRREFLRAALASVGVAVLRERSSALAEPIVSEPVKPAGLPWDDAESTPLQDIRAMVIRMEEQTGLRPDRLVMRPDVAAAVVKCEELRRACHFEGDIKDLVAEIDELFGMSLQVL